MSTLWSDVADIVWNGSNGNFPNGSWGLGDLAVASILFTALAVGALSIMKIIRS